MIISQLFHENAPTVFSPNSKLFTQKTKTIFKKHKFATIQTKTHQLLFHATFLLATLIVFCRPRLFPQLFFHNHSFTTIPPKKQKHFQIHNYSKFRLFELFFNYSQMSSWTPTLAHHSHFHQYVRLSPSQSLSDAQALHQDFRSMCHFIAFLHTPFR